MRKKNLLLTMLLFLCSASLFAQYENVWVFGTMAGLDFNQGDPPVSIITSLAASGYDAACASVCDASGKLLFYTEGDFIWDKNGKKMPNSSHLTPYDPVKMTSVIVNGQRIRIVDSNWSYTRGNPQGALIVPFPDDTNKYYVFSLTQTHQERYISKYPGKLFYSVVDMRLNGGLGDVAPGEKGIILDSAASFTHMSAVVGDNCNIWVVVKDHPNMVERDSMETFRAFEVTYSGVNQIPIISKPASSLVQKFADTVAGAYRSSYGIMCFSTDRSKLAQTAYDGSYWFDPVTLDQRLHKWSYLNLYDFNPTSGKVSNGLIIDSCSGKITGSLFDPEPPMPDSSLYYYGVCFSPNSQMLYANAIPYEAKDALLKGIFQYDLGSNNTKTIIDSRTLIDDLNQGDELSYGTTALKLGPDNKIYYKSGRTAPFSWDSSYGAIGRINFPDLKGLAANPISRISSLLDVIVSPQGDTVYAQSGTNFPNVVPVIKKDTLTHAIDTTICHSEKNFALSTLHRSPAAVYVWDDGSVDSIRSITSGGTYWVRTKDVCHYYIDTFHISYMYLDPVITIKFRELGTTAAYTSYQWLLNEQIIPDATNRTYTVSENGNYRVVVGNEYSCTDTSDVYKVTNVGIDEASLADHIRIYPNPATDIVYIDAPTTVHIVIHSIDGRLVRQKDKAKQIPISDLSRGVYLIKVYDQERRLLKTDRITH